MAATAAIAFSCLTTEPNIVGSNGPITMSINASNERAKPRNNGDERNEAESDDSNEEVASALLPRYLSPLVRHYHDDFYVSHSFDPRLIVQLMVEGFLPIATRGYLLPKLHVERCVLRLENLHISKSTRKKSKRFLLSVNESFDRVVSGCHQQHGINWLYPPIVNAFRAIHRRNIDSNGQGVNAALMKNDEVEACGSTPVRMYSVEIWNAETGALAGGELGYSVGNMYTSLTGFSCEDGAGSVQLVALGKLLIICGFKHWDLGMEMDYKRRLGAELIRRKDFVRKVQRTRARHKDLVLRCGAARKNAKELVDWERVNVTTKRIPDNFSNTACQTPSESANLSGQSRKRKNEADKS